MKTFLFQYRHEGHSWCFDLPARDFDDAHARLAAIAATGTVDGILVATLPAALGPLAIVGAWLRHASRRVMASTSQQRRGVRECGEDTIEIDDEALFYPANEVPPIDDSRLDAVERVIARFGFPVEEVIRMRPVFLETMDRAARRAIERADRRYRELAGAAGTPPAAPSSGFDRRPD